VFVENAGRQHGGHHRPPSGSSKVNASLTSPSKERRRSPTPTPRQRQAGPGIGPRPARPASPAATAGEAVEFAFEGCETVGGGGFAAEDVMGCVEELGADLVVFCAGHLGGTGDGVGEGIVEFAEKGGGLKDLGILIEASDGWIVRSLDRATLLLLLTGQVVDEIGRRFRSIWRRRAASRRARRCSCRQHRLWEVLKRRYCP